MTEDGTLRRRCITAARSHPPSSSRNQGAIVMSKFGWSYPPGAAGDPSAPWNQEDGPCAVCCKLVDACVCHECPTCGSVGDPNCYDVNGHRMKLRRKQVIARTEARIDIITEQLNTEKHALELLRQGGEFNDMLAQNPNPFR